MILYRVDKRTFQAGDTINSSGKSFIQDHDQHAEIKIKVEEILEAQRPNEKPKRDKILMLFVNQERAKRHWSISSNGFLYEVKIEESEILHRGDYEKVEKLYKIIQFHDSNQEAISIATEYWTEKNIKEPEIFVMSTEVSKVIGGERERIQYLSQRLNINPPERDEE